MDESTIIHGDCYQQLKQFPENYFDLCIADPPYFKVVNEKWDYSWRTKTDYVQWCLEWLFEVSRTLRFGGTFYLFGYFRHLAPLVSELLNIGFSLRQQIIINKGIQAVAGRATKKYKLFPNVTESILFLIKDNILYSRKLLKQRQKELGLSAKTINEKLGVKSNGGGMWSIYTGKNICEQFPTREIWNRLQEILQFSLPYEKIAQTFNIEMGITDVWSDISFNEDKRVHPTQKPKKLIQRLVSTSSNAGDKILDLFSGSGVTYKVSKELDRIPVAIEKEETYIKLLKNWKQV